MCLWFLLIFFAEMSHMVGGLSGWGGVSKSCSNDVMKTTMISLEFSKEMCRQCHRLSLNSRQTVVTACVYLCRLFKRLMGGVWVNAFVIVLNEKTKENSRLTLTMRALIFVIGPDES